MTKLPNIEIRKFADSDFDVFTKMVGVYFIDDLKEPLRQNPPIDMCKMIIQSVKDGITYIDLIHVDGTPIGFINYQVDSLESDWCEKEGYGCIREMYISKDYRKQGYGKTLAIHAENELKKLSVPYIYLTAETDDAISFWQSVGYTDTGEICNKNKGHILIK